MKAVFFGTPYFAVPSLEALARLHRVTAVVSQPDKPKGRGKKLAKTPVKAAAERLGIPVLQPVSARSGDFIESLAAQGADIFVVAAYGQILSEELLKLPPFGCINVHGSLLPKYRGAAPIAQAILDGEKKTGITIMYMEKRLDAGDMILKKETEISINDTFGTLHDRMAELGAEALCEALEKIENGTAVREPQDDSLSTYAGKITKEMGEVDFSKNTSDIINLIRAFDPVPGAYTYYEGNKIKVFSAEAADVPHGTAGDSGRIISADKRGIVVSSGDGALRIKELQTAGSKRMTAAAYLLGHKIEKDKTLGRDMRIL